MPQQECLRSPDPPPCQGDSERSTGGIGVDDIVGDINKDVHLTSPPAILSLSLSLCHPSKSVARLAQRHQRRDLHTQKRQLVRCLNKTKQILKQYFVANQESGSGAMVARGTPNAEAPGSSPGCRYLFYFHFSSLRTSQYVW